MGYFKHIVYPVIRTPAYYVIMTLQQINVWITVSVSVERYIAICHPFRAGRLITRKNTIRVMIGLTAVSLIYNLPRVFAYKTVACETDNLGEGEKNMSASDFEFVGSNEINIDLTIKDMSSSWSSTTDSSTKQLEPALNKTTSLYTLPNIHNSYFLPVTQSSSDTSAFSSPSSTLRSSTSSCFDVITTEFGQTDFYIFYRTIMYLIIIYVLPFLPLLVLNSFLFRELMTMQKRKVVTSRKEENEANLSLVLVLIVVVFLFCQTPGLISQFDIIHFSLFIPWLGFSNFLFTTNSAVNFLIYTAFGRKFRRVLLRVFRHVFTKDSSKLRGISTTRFSQVLTQAQDCGLNGNPAVEFSALMSDNSSSVNNVRNGVRSESRNGFSESTRVIQCDASPMIELLSDRYIPQDYPLNPSAQLSNNPEINFPHRLTHSDSNSDCGQNVEYPTCQSNPLLNSQVHNEDASRSFRNQNVKQTEVTI